MIKKFYNGMIEIIRKAGICTKDAEVEITQIKRLIKEIKFHVDF